MDATPNGDYKVVYKVYGIVEPNLPESKITTNANYELNFFRVADDDAPQPAATNAFPEGGSTGMVRLSEMNTDDPSCEDAPTTMSHEDFHLQGGQPDVSDDHGHPLHGITDPLKECEQPRMANPTNTETKDSGYAKRNKAGRTTPFIDPCKRAVTNQDIKDLHLEKLKFDKNNKANVGKITHQVYNCKGIPVKK